MPRKKAEFKNLGTLPQGKWRVVKAIPSGIILLACAEHEPMVIIDGRMSTLAARWGGKSSEAEKES
jgi:hypothetical protein